MAHGMNRNKLWTKSQTADYLKDNVSLSELVSILPEVYHHCSLVHFSYAEAKLVIKSLKDWSCKYPCEQVNVTLLHDILLSKHKQLLIPQFMRDILASTVSTELHIYQVGTIYVIARWLIHYQILLVISLYRIFQYFCHSFRFLWIISTWPPSLNYWFVAHTI